MVLSANASGKEICGVKFGDPKAKAGCFLTYNYTDHYAFGKKIVEKAVNLSFILLPIYQIVKANVNIVICLQNSCKRFILCRLAVQRNR